jgi:hypothetical protein
MDQPSSMERDTLEKFRDDLRKMPLLGPDWQAMKLAGKASLAFSFLALFGYYFKVLGISNIMFAASGAAVLLIPLALECRRFYIVKAPLQTDN